MVWPSWPWKDCCAGLQPSANRLASFLEWFGRLGCGRIVTLVFSLTPTAIYQVKYLSFYYFFNFIANLQILGLAVLAVGGLSCWSSALRRPPYLCTKIGLAVLAMEGL